MGDRYDNMPGKESSTLSSRLARYDAIHSENDAFAKRQNEELAKYAGKNPELYDRALKFNAHMCNNGEHAQEFAKELTVGLDPVAFPVK